MRPSQVIGVRRLLFFVLSNELFLLCRAHSWCEGCSRVCTGICWGCVVPGRIADDDAILFLGYVTLTLCKMGGLQFYELPPKLVFETVNSLTPKCVPAGRKNSRSERFWLAKHKHTNIPTMMCRFPSSVMVSMDKHTPPPGASSEGVGRGRHRRV
jgi:hypothetical protein